MKATKKKPRYYLTPSTHGNFYVADGETRRFFLALTGAEAGKLICDALNSYKGKHLPDIQWGELPEPSTRVTSCWKKK